LEGALLLRASAFGYSAKDTYVTDSPGTETSGTILAHHTFIFCLKQKQKMNPFPYLSDI